MRTGFERADLHACRIMIRNFIRMVNSKFEITFRIIVKPSFQFPSNQNKRINRVEQIWKFTTIKFFGQKNIFHFDGVAALGGAKNGPKLTFDKKIFNYYVL